MVRPNRDNFNNPGKLIGGGNPIYSYWTTFTRKNPFKWEIFAEEPKPLVGKPPEVWRFQTNIPPEDLSVFWDESRVKRFLYHMYDIYYGRSE